MSTTEKLHLTTIYPGPEPTPQMIFTRSILERVDGIELVVNWHQVGHFAKGNDQLSNEDTEEVNIRNRTLRSVPDNEFLIIIDSDEALGGLVQLIPYMLKAMRENDFLVAEILEILPDNNAIKAIPRPRIILKKDSMEYFFKHNIIRYKKFGNILHPDFKLRAEFHQLMFLHFAGVIKYEIYKDGEITDTVELESKHADKLGVKANNLRDEFDELM